MTAWTALRRALDARKTRRTITARAEIWRDHAEHQTRANGALLADLTRKGRRIAELEARVKNMKAREAALTSMLISALWQRGQVAHEVRKLQAVADPADAGGGEAA